MKVLYFHQHFNTPQGSGGTRSYEFARKLIERGHEVTMVCGAYSNSGLDLPAVEGSVERRGEVDGIRIIQFAFEYSNYDSLIKRSVIFLRFAWKSTLLAFTEKYDLLFATTTPLTAGIPGIVMKCFRRKPFVFEVRDLWPELPKAMGVVTNPFVLLGMSVLEWLCYRQADSCVGLSPGIFEGIKKRSQKDKRLEMIPNGCDLDTFRPGIREELELEGVGSEDCVAMFTGVHGVANGLGAVLDAARVLKQNGRSDIKLIFIGDGKLKPELQKRAKDEGLDNCLFFDPIPKTELAKLLGKIDVGLMILDNVPAFYYGTSPNKFFDYIASGIPVLNNYPGWLADMIGSNDCGKAVPPDDPEAFASALIALADNKELRMKMGKRSRELAESEFNRDQLADRFVDFLEGTCAP